MPGDEVKVKKEPQAEKEPKAEKEAKPKVKREPKEKKEKGEEGDGEKKKKPRKKKDPNAPKKNLSAFMCFSNEMRNKVKEENPGVCGVQRAGQNGEGWWCGKV